MADRNPPRSRSAAGGRKKTPIRDHRGRIQIDLALQGGGSHGAFTWGVLDRLLEVETMEIAAISGTSAGAMNAVAVAAGLMDGGRDGARRVLRQLWTRVAELSPLHHFHNSPLGQAFGPASAWMEPWLAPMQQLASQFTSQLSPYQFNPLNLNPLRDVLSATVDFERVRHCNKCQLFISATQVRTGALRIFEQADLNADMVLASACLPLLFQAVDIDGEAYWDGGYAGNPSLMPLITKSPVDDLLLVQINPVERLRVPTSAEDILDRVNEITFNASLLKELRTVALLQQLIKDEGRPHSHYRQPLFERLQSLRVHLLDGGASLKSLGSASKSNTQWGFLTSLHELGREAADLWLTQHGKALGKHSSFALDALL